MGTDRSTKFDGPCLCGRGTFHIDYCEVDHSWPTSNGQWYESYINCPDCSARFSLQERGNRFVLIEQAVLHERELRRQAASECATAILSDSEVRSVLGQFESMLGSQRSVAAIYRVLNGAGLEICTEGTFRRHWTNPATWIKRWARPNFLVQIFHVVGAPTERFEIMLSKLRALEQHAAQPAEPFGEPVHVLRI